MTTSSRTDFKANAIVVSEKTNKLFCSSCSVYDCEDWINHIETSSHNTSLEKFKATFEILEDHVCCKICTMAVLWDSIESHGKLHRIVPWYKPDNMYKILYEHHTLKFHCNYYCYLCDKIFLECSIAYCHTEMSQHQNIMQQIYHSKPIKGSQKFYEDLMSSGFVPGISGTIVCRFCNESNLAYDTTLEHIRRWKHSQNKSKFVEKLLKRIDNDNSRKSRKEVSSKPVETRAWAQILPAKSDAAPTNRHMKCNFFLESTANEKTLEEPGSCQKVQEKNNFEPVKFSNNCQEFIVDYVVSAAHRLCEEATVNPASSKRGKISKPTKDITDPYCLICRCQIADNLAVEDHVTGLRHTMSRERYRCEDILAIEGNTYYCTSCDCTVIGFENVYRHIITNSHTKSTTAMIQTAGEKKTSRKLCKMLKKPANAKEVTPETGDSLSHEKSNSARLVLDQKKITEKLLETPEEITNGMETPREAENIISQNDCMFVVRRNAKKSLCHICDDTPFSVGSKSLKEHIAGEGHKIALIRYGCNNIVASANAYHCQCCDLELADLENVYLHVKDKRHMSSMIKVARTEQTRAPKNLRDEFTAQFQNASTNNSLNQTQNGNLFREFPSNIETSRRSSGITSYQSMFDRINATQQHAGAFTNLLSKFKASARRDQRCSNATESDFLEFSKINQAKNIRTPRFDNVSLKQRNLLQMPKFPCNLCELHFINTTRLHVHMASHFVEEFACAKRKCDTNGPIENDAENDRNMANRTESPQFGSSTNGDVLQSNGDDVTHSDDTGRHAEGGLDQWSTMTNNNRKIAMRWYQKLNVDDNIKLENFNENKIYELSDKLADYERGMLLSLTVDSDNVYCLICQKVVENTLRNYHEHLSSVDHCANLDMMENDAELFSNFPEQISDMDLAHEYMEEISEDTVHCFICNQETANDESSIEEHIYDEIHEKRCTEIRERAKRSFEHLKPLIQCDWYKVQIYWCIVCRYTTQYEADFVKHLASMNHMVVITRLKCDGRKMVYDFCAPCSILWFGYRTSYFHHSNIKTHKWLTQDSYYLLSELPKCARSLLAAPEEFVENKIKFLDENHESERAKGETLLRDMETAVKTKFPRARAYTYGSRVSGLGSPDSDIDVYLDRGNAYDGNGMSKSQLIYFMNGVHQCLIKDSHTWGVREFLENCRSPIIRAHHRGTGLNCDISFQNGLSVENTKLIKALTTVFPMCRKMILFLKQWTVYCDLAGTAGMSSYALYWYVIFYLQKEAILPSIATLISMSKKSHIVAGWEVSFSEDFTYNKFESSYSTKEFLKKFFKFYANFDFRYYVACPLLGNELKKRDFLEPKKLPKEMALYVEYVQNVDIKPEYFRVDSVMCLQDPIDLQHNLTKAVSKAYLYRFRNFCSKSLDLLCST